MIKKYKKHINMKHIENFESFLNEAVGVLKFQGKEIYPEGYDQSILENLLRILTN
jgi:hypothetical protein